MCSNKEKDISLKHAKKAVKIRLYINEVSAGTVGLGLAKISESDGRCEIYILKHAARPTAHLAKCF